MRTPSDDFYSIAPPRSPSLPSLCTLPCHSPSTPTLLALSSPLLTRPSSPAGFWQTHLRDHPYHISALFVVDLAAFRSRGIGDQYRDTYHGLTADPNSLSNLDQDLPNYLQHSVRIHSLPEEWLWCETWCGNASKPSAKTIDLCNNPLTKEPKLDQARRIGGDRWTRMDDELRSALGA